MVRSVVGLWQCSPPPRLQYKLSLPLDAPTDPTTVEGLIVETFALQWKPVQVNGTTKLQINIGCLTKLL